MKVESVTGEDGETERRADAMKVQLRKDVDAWAKARREPSRIRPDRARCRHAKSVSR